ncbi:MAG: hypothetical protein J9259_10110 [Thermoplasmata archaeon YP2-bin.285]|uniref:Uncharacterized protein n=1 Tax=Candidatus Sysuiplasma superficiale TaxID=2823368 RepID=A0A8J7YR70_9ARCH|nr:hypothetical protein [Candidatus Sysuiplasma superficiale]
MALPDEKVIALRERLFSLGLERAADHKNAGRRNIGRTKRAGSHTEIIREDTEDSARFEGKFKIGCGDRRYRNVEH